MEEGEDPIRGNGVRPNISTGAVPDVNSDVVIDVPGRPDGQVPFFNQADRIYKAQLY